MQKILVAAVIGLFLLLIGGSCYAAPALDYWNFSYNADNARYVLEDGGNMSVEIENGVAYLTTELYNLTKNLEKGMHITMNISVEVSPLSISSGMKIIIGKDVMIEKELHTGNETIEFYAMRTYNNTENFTIVLYSYGGKMKILIENIQIEKPQGGMGEGLILTGIGITVVFLVLGILAAVMYLLKPSAKEKKKEAPKEIIEKKEARVDKNKEVDEEVVAAITGALSLYLGGKKFKIISVKPSPWKYYGRLKNMRRLK